jgi:selenocysteine lyase/cysteine desulfurase
VYARAETPTPRPRLVAVPTRPDPLALLDADLRVPLVTGGEIGYANFDYAASAPCAVAAADAVAELLPRYASVHRGAGLPSQACTAAYEEARRSVARFLGCRPEAPGPGRRSRVPGVTHQGSRDLRSHASRESGPPEADTVLFTRNTTDSTNLLAHALPADATVVVFDAEHHATLLPWRRAIRLPVPDSAGAAVRAVAAALHELRRDGNGAPILVAVTGASNVTGELWPVAEIVTVARRYGARVFLDAAQLAPHRELDVAALGVDYVALSGHKLYAPFGTGVLAGRADWLAAAPPYLAGGGATALVGDATNDVRWATGPARHEAGSPNVLGAVALAAVCDALAAADRTALAAREQRLTTRLLDGLAAIDGVATLDLFGAGAPRVGIAAFAIPGLDSDLLAAALSAEHGIGVRDGLFCAHPLTRRLLRTTGLRTAVRASIGLGTTDEHVSRLLSAVAALAADGPQWTYEYRDGRPVPSSR